MQRARPIHSRLTILRSGAYAPLALLCIVACSGDVTPSGAIIPTDTTTHHDTTIVQRGALTVTVAIDSPDASVAAAAHVSVAGLTVVLQRDLSNDAPQTAVTDANGAVKFEQLLQGPYRVSVDRPLTPTEIAQLAPDDREATIFAAASSVDFAPPARSTAVSLVANRRGSLVLSEFWRYSAGVAGLANNGHYLEFYNNGDTTVYMDGMLLFRTFLPMHGYFDAAYPCETVNRNERLDSTGVWVTVLERFPGNGRDFSVQPGSARVWALDAVDHRVVAPESPDLRNADFESIGDASDPNNPYAADMIRMKVVISFHGPPLGTGIMIGLALPIAVDTSQLERRMLSFTSAPGGLFSAFKIPRAAVLDVTGVRRSPEAEAAANLAGFTYCQPFASPTFERAESQITDYTPLAVRRKSLGRSASGAEILQRTRTSARDFEHAPPLQRSLLKAHQ